ncbi:unnamed protein product, partial [Polarella glacialis]
PWPPARTVDWDPSLVELTQSTRSRLPAAVAESWGRARQRANCGLFTEVQHAWVSVDSTLYLWDYCQENPAVLSVPADSAIISVAACAPRAGVFEGSLSSAAGGGGCGSRSRPQVVLVLATKLTVSLVGLGIASSGPLSRSGPEDWPSL